MQPIYKQVETIQLAPDALVFINGSDTVKDANGNVYEIRNDITDLSVDLDIASSPGTANFTISMPDHSIRRFADRRYNALRLMSEVEIYFKGRFPRTTNDGRLFYPYYPCFWGVLTSVNENYSDGVHTISVTCADILRWWEITNIAINPSVGAVTNSQAQATQNNPKVVDQASNQQGIVTTDKDGRQISPYGNIYAGMTIPEILIDLSKLTLKDLAPIIDFATGQVAGTVDKIGSSAQKQSNDIEIPIMQYWVQRFNQTGRNLKIFGINKVKTETTTTLEKIPTEAQPITVTDKNSNVTLDNTQFDQVIPYMLDESSPSAMQTTTMSKMEVAKHCAEIVQFEFFMDINGEIVFKPPFYNIDVRKNQNSVINDVDIINWGFNQSEAEVVSRMDVTGQYNKSFGSSKVDEVIKGVAVNTDLAQKFGVRAQQRHVTWINDSTKCLQYAQAELNRMGALLLQGSVTLMGRPELRLGYPVFIPARDAFYYIKGISHSFSFGGTFTTTLTLIAERKKRIDNNGNPIKNEYFRAVGELQDTTTTVVGNSVAVPATSDNFLQQMTDLCIPNKKATIEEVIEPDFIPNKENLKSMAMGQWERLSFVKLENPDLTKEYNTTDSEGYEIIPFFLFAGTTQFTSTSVVKSIDQVRSNAASQAQNLSPEDFYATADPNNTALTLDNEDASMLNIYDDTPQTNANKAQQMDIK